MFDFTEQKKKERERAIVSLRKIAEKFPTAFHRISLCVEDMQKDQISEECRCR